MEDGSVTQILAEGIFLVDRDRHDSLKSTEFNPAADGMASENMFTNEFATEVADVMKMFSDYFEQHGEFGSSERYGELPSDWWIGDDFYSTSRVLFIDLLNPKLQTVEIIRGVQNLLSTLKHDWMILLGHDNDYDAMGNFVGKDGEYWIWITSTKVQIYSELPEDLNHLMKSLAATQKNRQAQQPGSSNGG